MRKATLLLAVLVALNGCASFAKKRQVVHEVTHPRSVKLARAALELLDPVGEKYDPERGKTYLEYSLKHGSIKNIDVPASVLLELLRSEKIASDKSRALEQQLEIMKEIDLSREEEL